MLILRLWAIAITKREPEKENIIIPRNLSLAHVHIHSPFLVFPVARLVCLVTCMYWQVKWINRVHRQWIELNCRGNMFYYLCNTHWSTITKVEGIHPTNVMCISMTVPNPSKYAEIWLCVRATLSNIPKWVSCGLYKKLGVRWDEIDGVIVIRYDQEW